MYVKIVLELIFSPAKTYHYPSVIKGTTNYAVSSGSKNSRETF